MVNYKHNPALMVFGSHQREDKGGLDELRGPHQEWVIAYKLVSQILDLFPAFPCLTATDEFWLSVVLSIYLYIFFPVDEIPLLCASLDWRPHVNLTNLISQDHKRPFPALSLPHCVFHFYI